jgi:hypothetical protein
MLFATKLTAFGTGVVAFLGTTIEVAAPVVILTEAPVTLLLAEYNNSFLSFNNPNL